MVQLTALLTVLATSSLLVSATHQQTPRRNHHSRVARRVARNNERSAAEPAVVERDGSAARQIRVRKRTDSKICRIRTSGSNSTTTATSASTTMSTSTVLSASSTATSASSTSSFVSQAATESASTSIEVESDLVAATSVVASSTAAATSTGKVASTSAASSSAAPTSVASTSAAATSAATSTTTASTSSSSLTPNGKKAGIAGGDSYEWMQDYIGWWYDWSASPSGHTGTPKAVNMIWGDGNVDSTDASRLAAFEALTTTPEWIIGFEEPDCTGSGSAGFGYSTGVTLWDSVVAPWKDKGSILLSPSMCHQAAESGWLPPFEAAISTPWDVTNIHINKNSMDGVKADIDHYYNTYGKPIWVTEFACVDDSTSFVPCTDQTEIDTFIADIVDLFEADSRVYAYAYSDGEGLGSVWPTVSNGALSASGQAYLSAISKY